MKAGGGRRILVATLMTALALAALRDLSRLGSGMPWRNMDDFPDFYCAGGALDLGASPYTYEPLHGCEHRVNSGGAFRSAFFAANPALAVPAPLPAYDFLPFMAMARVSVGLAAFLDAAAILAAVALTALALWRLRISLPLVLAALALSTAYMELNTGQVVPFALLAVVLAGLALARRRDGVAGALAAFAAIEPAVGLPVVVATLIFVPRARWSVLLCSAVLAVVSLRLVGAQGLVRYVSAVLPAQAAAELHFPYQYSLSYALAYVGLPDRVAGFAGGVSYALIAAAGIVLGLGLARRLQRRELLLFVPALCSVVGGTYVHPEELCFAIPALLVLASVTRGVPRAVLALALCALAVPWILVWGMKQLFLASMFVCAVILLQLRADGRLALAALGAIAAVVYLFELHPPHLPPPVVSAHVYAASELVQEEWRRYVQARSTRDVFWFAIKLPAWAAFAASIVVARLIARGKDAGVTPPIL